MSWIQFSLTPSSRNPTPSPYNPRRPHLSSGMPNAAEDSSQDLASGCKVQTSGRLKITCCPKFGFSPLTLRWKNLLAGFSRDQTEGHGNNLRIILKM